MEPAPIHYLPLGTTVVSAVFCGVLIRAALTRRSGPHLAWWAFGIACYGLGTAIEGWITLAGNTVALTKAWYVAGALLGGYPLAQGTAYLLLKRRTANVLTAVTVAWVAVAAALVVASPVNAAALEAHRPSGDVLSWTWVRALTPLLNGYAAVLLIGGAIVSARRYARIASQRARAVGNSLIAAGAILPGIGGGFAKAGHVEVLYVGEFLGLLLIWAGYHAIASRRTRAAPADFAAVETPAPAAAAAIK